MEWWSGGVVVRVTVSKEIRKCALRGVDGGVVPVCVGRGVVGCGVCAAVCSCVCFVPRNLYMSVGVLSYFIWYCTFVFPTSGSPPRFFGRRVPLRPI